MCKWCALCDYVIALCVKERHMNSFSTTVVEFINSTSTGNNHNNIDNVDFRWLPLREAGASARNDAIHRDDISQFWYSLAIDLEVLF